MGPPKGNCPSYVLIFQVRNFGKPFKTPAVAGVAEGEQITTSRERVVLLLYSFSAQRQNFRPMAEVIGLVCAWKGYGKF